MIALPTPEATFDPQTITVKSGKECITLTDILIGEVWLCGGQSNMEMYFRGFDNSPVEGAMDILTDAHNHSIRVATIKKGNSKEPLDYTDGSWKVSNFENAKLFTAVGYHFALVLENSLNVPIGLIDASYGGTDQECWIPKYITDTYPDIVKTYESTWRENERVKRYRGTPYGMYNAMIHPCCNYTIKGIIFYQGCNNVHRPMTYADRMVDLIDSWRDAWGLGDIPFYQVEITPRVMTGGADAIWGSLLRDQQLQAAQRVANGGIVCTNDCTYPDEFDNAHPRNKKTIGERLAWMALQRCYQLAGIDAQSPIYKSMEVIDNTIHVAFDNAKIGLHPWHDIKGFEIAGDDQKFYPADVKLGKLGSVIVSSPQVQKPVAVRYCFKNYQIGNLRGVNGLPVHPFRTDNFPHLTTQEN
jgi:sialate O-acetylesterase